MDAAGAVWGTSWDMEVPLYFAPEGFIETPHAETLQRLSAGGRGMPRNAAVRGPARYLGLFPFRGVGASGRSVALTG